MQKKAPDSYVVWGLLCGGCRGLALAGYSHRLQPGCFRLPSHSDCHGDEENNGGANQGVGCRVFTEGEDGDDGGCGEKDGNEL